jgi:hypothetical protein
MQLVIGEFHEENRSKRTVNIEILPIQPYTLTVVMFGNTTGFAATVVVPAIVLPPRTAFTTISPSQSAGSLFNLVGHLFDPTIC